MCAFSISKNCPFKLFNLAWINGLLPFFQKQNYITNTSALPPCLHSRPQETRKQQRSYVQTQRQWSPQTEVTPSLMAPEKTASAESQPRTLPHDSVPLVEQAVLLLGCLSHSTYQGTERGHTQPKTLGALGALVKRVSLKLRGLQKTRLLHWRATRKMTC